ncbi:MAG: IS21 family transposase [Deltaproteobacteria bacterium]|nr:IS21 family transposase [Deltaproteobacteria bacterium]
MIDLRTIFEIHRMANEGSSVRKIAENLQLSRKTVKKYLEDPNPKKPVIKRANKLDSFKDEIKRLLEIDHSVSAVVIQQRIAEKGFDGEITIIRNYLRKVRNTFKKKSFIRFESLPGQQCQIDWGHFGSIRHGNTNRKLYCMAVVECHSRLLYLEFTHSQRQEALHRCLLNAFCFFHGTPAEIVHDNMITAVIERDGSLIRFNESFLEFLRPFKITPKACNVRKPNEKGKIENSIKYIRNNFIPLRSFTDLKNVQTQADHWRDHVANQRMHNTTGEKPGCRFKQDAMRPLPELLPDCRDAAIVKVHSDFSIRFDCNNYTVPPWTIGKKVVAKGDNQTITVYYKDKPIAVHERNWQRRQRIELAGHREDAEKQIHRKWHSDEVAALISLGQEAKVYLERLAETRQSFKKHVRKIFALKCEYGAYSLIAAIKRASSVNAYGAQYIENILYQDMTPERNHPPVRLKKEYLNRICLEEPILAEYDTFIIKRKKRL